MAKRLVGIDFDRRFVRIVVAAEEKGEITLQSASRLPCGSWEELPAAIRETVGDEFRHSDRLAAALPAGEGFARWLRFPFSDEKKIEATLSFELAAQLPVSLDDFTTVFQKPLPDEEGFRVSAAAARSASVAGFLEPFDGENVPLHILDLSPFSYAAGLRAIIGDGLLASVTEGETVIARIREGRVADYLLLPSGAGDNGEGRARFLEREALLLLRKGGRRDLPLYLIGSRADKTLFERLRESGFAVEIPQLPLDNTPMEPEFMPAAALALRAGLPAKEREFNFRRGDYALKSEWAALKKGLIAASALLLLSVLALGGAAYLNYTHKAGRAEALSQEMVKIFRQTFPGAKAIVDVPLQMRSGISELEKKGGLIGAGKHGSALSVLREVSRNTPDDITVDIRDLSYAPESVRLEGYTTSFDAINRMARSLQQSPLFKEAQITDAKMSLDGSRVDFRITLSFSEEQQTP